MVSEKMIKIKYLFILEANQDFFEFGTHFFVSGGLFVLLLHVLNGLLEGLVPTGNCEISGLDTGLDWCKQSKHNLKNISNR